jgi:ElaB/YqjD/DUF883 family membrane-anchored ribosome-binding protein
LDGDFRVPSAKNGDKPNANALDAPGTSHIEMSFVLAVTTRKPRQPES